MAGRFRRPVQPPETAGITWTVSPSPTGVSSAAGVPATKTLMCGRSVGPDWTSRSRMPGTERSNASITAATDVTSAISCRRAVPGNNARSDPGRTTVTMIDARRRPKSAVEDDGLDRPDLGEVGGDELPAHPA